MRTEGRYLGPPGPFLQKLNARLHEEPLQSIVYCLVWTTLLLFAVPVVVVALFVLTAVRLINLYTGRTGDNDCDPQGPQQETKQLAVVITGCDTGFGKELALVAAKSGFFVFAACLKQESFQQFEVLEEEKNNIRPIQVDVTSDEDVNAMANLVQEWLSDAQASATTTSKKRVLHALVNNAGIGLGADIDWSDLKDFQRCMDVNYFGVVRCCKAVFPILKQQSVDGTHTASRILNLVSCSGMIPAGVGLGLYSPSKHAAAAFSAFLRREMKAFDIQVTTVNPSFHGTDIVHGMADMIANTWNKLSQEKRDEYGEAYFEKVLFWGADVPACGTWKMEVVVDQMLKCLKMRYTPAELVIGTDGRFFLAALRMFPAWVVDLLSGPRPVPAVMATRKPASQ